MRLIVTDAGNIWNHNNPILKQYKKIVLVVCLYGKKVTDEYKCFVSPYTQSEESRKEGTSGSLYRCLESVADDLNDELHYYDDFIFLTDNNPESLYPFHVIKDRNKYRNRLHLVTMSPRKNADEHEKRIHQELLSDLSEVTSLCYIDSAMITGVAPGKCTDYQDFDAIALEKNNALFPRILYGIVNMEIWRSYLYFDMASMSYVPLKEGFSSINLNKRNEEVGLLKEGDFCGPWTLGSVAFTYYPVSENETKDEIERPVFRTDGKRICNLLRAYRIKLAEMNNIEFVSEECPSIGPCGGTCEKCDHEAIYLRDRLAEIPEEKRGIPVFSLPEEVTGKYDR